MSIADNTLLSEIRNGRIDLSDHNLHSVCMNIEQELGGNCFVEIDITIGSLIYNEHGDEYHILDDISNYGHCNYILVDTQSYLDTELLNSIDHVIFNETFKKIFFSPAESLFMFRLSEYEKGIPFFSPDITSLIAYQICEDYLTDDIKHVYRIDNSNLHHFQIHESNPGI